MAHTKCLFAIVFLACQVHTQASVEVQSGSLLLVTLAQNQTGRQTGVSPDSNSTGTCQLIEVAAKSATCNGQNSEQDVEISILSSSPSLPPYPSCPTPQCPSCPAHSCPTCPPPPPSTTTPPPPVLLQGYERVPNLGCYKYHTNRAPWEQAKKKCEDEGSHLAIINSEAESKAISNLMKRDEAKVAYYREYSWLGLIESNTTQHEYYTVLGDPLSATGFTRWRSGYPHLTSLGDNVCLYSGNGGLGDYRGGYSFTFTCEQFTC